jgi:AmiR/NasT family two-component response regulator
VTGGSGQADGLRIVAADEDREALDETAALLRECGHEVTSYAIGVREAAERVTEDEPDLAVVVLHGDPGHALDLIEELVEYASGPVVALIEDGDEDFARRAAERGVDAVARPRDARAVQEAIEVAMRRHAERRRLAEEVAQLAGAIDRRAVIERAKGILMERHSVSERAAFEMLRDQARRTNRSVVALAHAVAEGHALLPKR